MPINWHVPTDTANRPDAGGPVTSEVFTDEYWIVEAQFGEARWAPVVVDAIRGAIDWTGKSHHLERAHQTPSHRFLIFADEATGIEAVRDLNTKKQPRPLRLLHVVEHRTVNAVEIKPVPPPTLEQQFFDLVEALRRMQWDDAHKLSGPWFGWRAWTGGALQPPDLPNGDDEVEVMFRNGERATRRAIMLYWVHAADDAASDIIAYRPVTK